MPTPRGHMCSTLLVEGNDYLVVTVGGSQAVKGDRPLASVEVFNATSRKWEPWSNLTYARMNAACAVGLGGVVVGLGRDGAREVEYIANTNTYLLPNLPQNSSSACGKELVSGALTTLNDTSICLVCISSYYSHDYFEYIFITELWVLEDSSLEWKQGYADTLVNMSSIVKVDSTGSLFLTQISYVQTTTVDSPPVLISTLFFVENGSLMRFQCSVLFSCPVLLSANTSWVCLFTTSTSPDYWIPEQMKTEYGGPAWPQQGGNANYTFQGKGDWGCFPVVGTAGLRFTLYSNGISNPSLVGIDDVVFQISQERYSSTTAFNGSDGSVIFTSMFMSSQGIVGSNGQLYMISNHAPFNYDNELIELDRNTGQVIQQYQINNNVNLISTGSDGSIYAYSTSSNQIHIFDLNLQQQCIVNVSDANCILQVLGSNDMIYARNGSYLWAYDHQQQLAWTLNFSPHTISLMSLAYEVLYFCLDDRVVSVNATGNITHTLVNSGSLAFYNNTLLIYNGALSAYELDTFDLLWCQSNPWIKSEYSSTMITGSAGTIFLATSPALFQTNIWAIDINTGAVKWFFPNSDTSQDLVIGSDGNLYCGYQVFGPVEEEWISSEVEV